MFDYPLLEVLHIVEKEGNFDRAAKLHGVTKSAISQSLSLLEQRMGAVVVNRDTVKLTPFGIDLCRHLEKVRLRERFFLAKNADLFDDLEQVPSMVTVSVSDDSLSYWLHEIIFRSNDLFNHSYLDVVVADDSGSKLSMENGQILAALSSTKSSIDGFESIYLGQHRHRAVASPTCFKKYFNKGVTLDALENAPSLRLSTNDKLIERWGAQMNFAGLCNGAATLPSCHGIVNATLLGSAWSVSSSLLVDQQISSGQLIELMPNSSVEDELYWHIESSAKESLTEITNAIKSKAIEQMVQSKLTGIIGINEFV